MPNIWLSVICLNAISAIFRKYILLYFVADKIPELSAQQTPIGTSSYCQTDVICQLGAKVNVERDLASIEDK